MRKTKGGFWGSRRIMARTSRWTVVFLLILGMQFVGTALHYPLIVHAKVDLVSIVQLAQTDLGPTPTFSEPAVGPPASASGPEGTAPATGPTAGPSPSTGVTAGQVSTAAGGFLGSVAISATLGNGPGLAATAAFTAGTFAYGFVKALNEGKTFSEAFQSGMQNAKDNSLLGIIGKLISGIFAGPKPNAPPPAPDETAPPPDQDDSEETGGAGVGPAGPGPSGQGATDSSTPSDPSGGGGIPGTGGSGTPGSTPSGEEGGGGDGGGGGGGGDGGAK